MEKQYSKTPHFIGLYDVEHNKKSLQITGSEVKRITLQEIKDFPWADVKNDSSHWPAMQMFDAPMRISDIHNHPEYWQHWNGCVFVDVDLKHLTNEQRIYPVEEIRKKIGEDLQNDKNLYAFQESRSQSGLHYIFYFEVDRSECNFRKCAKIAQNRIRHSIKKRMHNLYANIEEYDRTHSSGKIVDDCSLIPSQPLIMTMYPLYRGQCLSDEDFGVIDFSTLKPWELSDEEMANSKRMIRTNNGLTRDGAIWSFDNAMWDGNYGDIFWCEPACFQLSTFLYLIGVDFSMAHDLFFDMFKNGFNGRKSNWRQIEREFKQAWNGAHKYQIDKLSAKYIMFAKEHLNIIQYDKADAGQQQTDQQKLDEYIASHDGHKWPYMPFVADRMISLNTGQYIENISSSLEQMMKNALTDQIYIYAGCGTGKTKYIISKFK